MADEITKGNELIAHFMGTPHDIQSGVKVWWFTLDGGRGSTWNTAGKLEYLSSWDWLMPVMLRIGMSWRWKIEKFGCKIYVRDKTIEYAVKDSNANQDLKYCTWLAVIDFIKDYNEENFKKIFSDF